jgi:hypothetical protein
MVKPRIEKGDPEREHRPAKEQEEFHRDLEAPRVAGEPIDEGHEIEAFEVERTGRSGRSKLASSTSKAIVSYQIVHIYPMFSLPHSNAQ